ncbi:MAG: hypothetical protein JRG74_14205 [Deltaproteobacteria bacterium]|nr:hypothetical protein [Deltaproteobacteria bacterium]
MNMKVSLWKVLSIAVALLLSCAVTSDAFKVQVDEDTWADFAVRGQLSYKNFDKRSEAIDYRKNYFELTEAEFYVKGQINDLIQFFTQWECVYKPLKLDGTDRSSGYKKDGVVMKETGMNFLFAPEFKVRFGRIRIPVSRYHQRSDYGKIIQTDYFYRYDIQEVFTGKDLGLKVNKTALNIREPGVVFYGDPFDGMLRYHLGLFNQPNNEDTDKKYNYKGLRYTARLAFTPTMLGFKPESSLKGTRKDSYLGKKDILTIGAGYSKEEIWKDLNNEMYAVDAFFEKKFGSIVPNLGCGYIKAKKTHRELIDGRSQDSAFWFVQGQLLYDEVVGFGKPAIAAKFERMESDKAYANKDVKSDRLSVALNYYFEGYSAWISLGLDNVKYKDGAKDYLVANNKEDSFTDYTLSLQFIF